jgi:hypothetical protein
MPSNPTRQQQDDDFDNFRPILNRSEEAAASEIVSCAVLQAIPGGALLKLATKTMIFGSFRLTPVAVSELVSELYQTNPQHR